MRLGSVLHSWINMAPNGLAGGGKVESSHHNRENTFCFNLSDDHDQHSLSNRYTISLIFISRGKISLCLKCLKEIGGNGKWKFIPNWKLKTEDVYSNMSIFQITGWLGLNDIFALTLSLSHSLTLSLSRSLTLSLNLIMKIVPTLE